MYSFLSPAPPRVFNQALKVPYYSQADPTLVLDSFLRPGTLHRYREVSAPGNDSGILSTNPVIGTTGNKFQASKPQNAPRPRPLPRPKP
jgi:hypothetical protein